MPKKQFDALNVTMIASMIARREGKTSEALVGDVREILGILSEMMASDPDVAKVLEANGRRRLKRAK